jgi:hypothetical protein
MFVASLRLTRAVDSLQQRAALAALGAVTRTFEYELEGKAAPSVFKWGEPVADGSEQLWFQYCKAQQTFVEALTTIHAF